MERRLLEAAELTPGAGCGGQARSASPIGRSARCWTSCPSTCASGASEWGMRPVYKMVDTCAAEFEAATPYFYSTYEAGERSAAARRAEGARHRLRADPHRPGHRVRLLLGPRGAGRCSERGVASDHDQLQPRDGLDRLRRLRPPLLRAARRGVGARRPRQRDAALAGSRPRSIVAVRRPDRDQPRRAARTTLAHRLLGSDLRRDRPRRGPRPVRATCSTISASRSRRAPACRTLEEALRLARAASATRCWCARRYVLGGRAMEIVHERDRAGALHSRRRRGRLGQARPDRQVPRGQRGRGRRDLRRRGRADPGHHGAHRARRRALRRLHRGLPGLRL